MQIRVYYEDTDCGGVVYHSNYLNFCERARSEFFFEKGLSPHQDNAFFVVKHIEADYIKSAVFADILDIQTNVLQIKGASMQLEQKIFKNHELLFNMNVTVAYLINGRPGRIPQEIKELFS